MKQIYRKIHNRFRLNGISYSHDDLKEVSYSLVKEGEAFEKAIGNFLLDWTDGHPILKVHTSGSTGKPKSITLQKQHMVNSAEATGAFFGLRPGDSALLCLPADYIAGKMMLVRAMVLGLELDYVPPSSNPLSEVSKTYDFCAMVPLQLENSLENIERIRTLIVGGAPLSDKVQAQVQKLQTTNPKPQTPNFSTAVFETYGMTETITHIAFKKVHVAPEDLTCRKNTTEAQTHRPHFKTLPNVSLSTDDRGCLIINAPKVTDSPVVTNDVVNLVSETEFQWLGRYDNVINSGGVKLFPEQIEAKLAPIISARFFVAALSDEKLGEKLVLVVEGTVGEEKLLQEIRSLNTLGNLEVPKKIYPVSKFRMTGNGKIHRKKTLVLAQS